jgi:hypothetical protein
MEEGHSEILKAELIGDAPQDYIDKYIFDNENNNIIDVQQSHNQFRITAMQRGRSVLKIKNAYADFDREVLVIVNGINSIQDNEIYITTNQNVVTTEVGGDDVLLTMTLVGGNEADRNNFVWTVDDGSVISVENAPGRVEYRNRAAVSNSNEKFEAQAFIKAKKVGTAKITLENPKAKNDFTVLVKVYKKGTFGIVPIVLDGPGVFKVGIGGQLPAYLRVVTGNERNLTNIKWKSDNENIVSVGNSAGLTGMLEGIGTGITTITVSADNVKGVYTATVVVGNENYLNTMPFIYVNNPFMPVVKGESVPFQIMCQNMSEAEIAALSVVNNTPDVMEIVTYKNNVLVTGKAVDEGEIIISGVGLNTLRVVIMVEDYDLTPDMSFYLRTEKYIYGVVKGRTIEIGVDLVGGSAADERGIIWSIEDSNVALLHESGKSCIVTGRNVGQTVIRVKRPKSRNELDIVLYVVEKEPDLGKVVMYAKESNMLLNIGETRYITIITNAVASQQSGFVWGNSNRNVIDMGVSGDRIKASVMAKSAGSATVTVQSGEQVPVVIYITVISDAYNAAYINVPSIVEMAAGQTLSINAVTGNIYDIMNIKWASKDETIALVYGNGKTGTVTASKGGNTVIGVTYEPSRFIKNILLYVYATQEEMASRYIIAGEQSRYVINEGDIINIGLVFGMKGYPDYEIPNIVWDTEDKTKIEVAGNGKTATVRGKNQGIGTVVVTDRYGNRAEIEVEVKAAGKAGKYYFSIDEKITGILAGASVAIPVRVFNGSSEVYNISGVTYTASNTDIVNVTPGDGGMIVTAAGGKEGQSYIDIRHDLVKDARILIYTSLSENGLRDVFPILIEKTNYLMAKGSSETIMIETLPNADAAQLRNIEYRLEKRNGVINIQERNKKEIVVSADNAGSDVIQVLYNADVVQRVYVSVTEGSSGPDAGYMVTENIIVLLMNEEYETKVETNIEYGISWKKDDNYIIDFVRTSGKTAVIKGFIPGRTELNVSGGGFERNISVIVCGTEDELKACQAINIDQRKYRIRKNDNVTVNIGSYQGRVEGETKYGDYYNHTVPYGNVIAVNTIENNKFSIKGINEGMAAIRVKNDYYSTEIIVYVEVYPAGDGGSGIVDKKHYITAAKTLYVIDPLERDVFMIVSVIGENFYGDGNWHWDGYNPDIISVNFMGREAIVNPTADTGQTKIRVWNDDCENQLEITVIIGDRFIIDDSSLPYIYVEKSLYEVTRNGSGIGISYNILNVANIVKKNIRYELYSPIISVDHDVDNSIFKVTASETGIARFDIVYGSLRQEVYVLVKDNFEYSGIFLTTNENYVVVSIGELRPVNISLAGYEDIINDNFQWSVDKAGIIGLAGNGLVGQVYGIGAGDAVITVTHKNENEEFRAKNNLTIHVRVVRDKIKEKVVYLTTQRNVIETVAGTDDERIYVQKIGGNVAINNTTWSVSDGSIIDLRFQGYSAAFKALKAGMVKITVKNDESNYPLEIIIIVKPSLNNNIYISTNDTLLWLSPGQQRKIAAELVNGDPKNNSKFQWSVNLQTPSDVEVKSVNGNVITIIGSNQECIINAINEGWAEIRVKNEGKEGAERDLIITVYVSLYKEISFSVSRKELVIGESEFIGINLPTYEYFKDKAFVSAENIDGGYSDVCDVFYTNSMVLLKGRKEGVAVIKAAVEGKEGQAQMLVEVVEKINPNLNRIITEKSIYVLSPRSKPLVLNAVIGGPTVYEQDYEDIRWDFSMDTQKKVVDFIPKTSDANFRKRAPDMTLTKEYQAKGPTVQITPTGGTGTVNITVWHGFVDEPQYKNITVIVADLGNRFSVNTTDITVNSTRPETVTARITGGTTRDYEEIVWIAKMQQKWDGTMIEVVRIMGSGREVTLYPMNDGETEVFAIYNGETIPIKVKVVSDYYFSFRSSNELMFPGERRDLHFDIKPVSSNVNWINVSNPGEDPVVSYSEVMGSAPGGEGEVNRYLQVEARREGTTSITGMANGKIATVNIIVNYDYFFIIDDFLAGNPEFMPKHSITGNKSSGGSVDASSSDGVRYASYTIHPFNTYIKPVEPIPDGLEIEVLPPEKGLNSRGQSVGYGKIKFTGLKEMRKDVVFRQYKPQTPGVNGETPVEAKPAQPGQRTINVLYCYPTVNPRLFFVRGEGKYSNATNPSTTGAKPVISSTPYRLAKNNQSLQGAENLVSNNLYLGDGEAHYILFDEVYDNSELVIKNVVFGDGDNSAAVNGVTFKAEVTDFSANGVTRKGILLSSDKDYIEYNRVMFDQELFVYVSSAHARGTVDIMPKYSEIGEKIDKIYTVEQPQYMGSWTIYTGAVRSDTGKKYYLLKNSYFDSCSESAKNRILTTFKAKFIKTELSLYFDWNNNDYTYYFTGDEYSRTYQPFNANTQYANVFNDLLDNQCDTTYKREPALRYGYSFLRGSTGGRTNYQILAYDHSNDLVANYVEMDERSGQITGGYIVSFYDMDGYVGVGSTTRGFTVYRYIPSAIQEIISESTPVFVNGIRVNFNVSFNNNNQVIGWNKGTFEDSYGAYLGEDYVPYTGNVRNDEKQEYLYSSISYQINDYDISEGTEKYSKFNVLRGAYVLANNTEQSTPPNGLVSLYGLEYIADSSYSREGMAWAALSGEYHMEPGFWGFLYNNLTYPGGSNEYYYVATSNQGTYSLTGGKLGGTVVYENPNGFNIFATAVNGNYSRYFYPFHHASWQHTSVSRWNDDCFNRGSRCYGYYVYFKSRARQRLSWENTGRKTIVPYYIFNKWPYRYENSNNTSSNQYVKLTDGGGKPMPSISRNYGSNYKSVYLRINYQYFDKESANNNYIKTAYKDIPVYLYVRPCHSQYMGDQSIDSYVNNNADEELQGEYKDFSQIPAAYSTLRKFY